MGPSASFAILATCNIFLCVQSRKWPIRELQYFVSNDTCVLQYLLSSDTLANNLQHLALTSLTRYV